MLRREKVVIRFEESRSALSVYADERWVGAALRLRDPASSSNAWNVKLPLDNWLARRGESYLGLAPSAEHIKRHVLKAAEARDFQIIGQTTIKTNRREPPSPEEFLKATVPVEREEGAFEHSYEVLSDGTNFLFRHEDYPVPYEDGHGPDAEELALRFRLFNTEDQQS